MNPLLALSLEFAEIFCRQLLLPLLSLCHPLKRFRKTYRHLFQFSTVALSCPTLRPPWTAAHQTSLSITNSRGLIKLMSTESVMPSNHFTLCHPLLLLPSIFPRIRVFSNESVLCIRWPNYWSFSFSISPSKVYSGLISITRVQKHQFFVTQLSL